MMDVTNFSPFAAKRSLRRAGKKQIHQTATLRRDAFAGERWAKKARMETGSVSSSPMQLGARQGAALTAQKARANARAALGSEIVKFAVMDDVAIAICSIANFPSVVGWESYSLSICRRASRACIRAAAQGPINRRQAPDAAGRDRRPSRGSATRAVRR